MSLQHQRKSNANPASRCLSVGIGLEVLPLSPKSHPEEGPVSHRRSVDHYSSDCQYGCEPIGSAKSAAMLLRWCTTTRLARFSGCSGLNPEVPKDFHITIEDEAGPGLNSGAPRISRATFWPRDLYPQFSNLVGISRSMDRRRCLSDLASHDRPRKRLGLPTTRRRRQRMTSTEHSAWKATCSDTLPMVMRSNPPRP